MDYITWVEDTPPMILKNIRMDVISTGLSYYEWKTFNLDHQKKKKNNIINECSHPKNKIEEELSLILEHIATYECNNN